MKTSKKNKPVDYLEAAEEADSQDSQQDLVIVTRWWCESLPKKRGGLQKEEHAYVSRFYEVSEKKIHQDRHNVKSR